MREYRICWSATTDIGFHGATDWSEWDGDEEDEHDDIERELCVSGGRLCEGLEIALEASGFDWRVETR